jgi:hypothetical protein
MKQIVINIGAMEKINFILEDHRKLISMTAMPDSVRHTLYKDVTTVKKILGCGETQTEGGGKCLIY